MDIKVIYQRLEDASAALRKKLPPAHWFSLELRVHYTAYSPFKLHLYVDNSILDIPEFGHQDPAQDLDILDAWIARLPSHEISEKRAAMKSLGQAMDNCRDVGIEIPFNIEDIDTGNLLTCN